MIRARSITELFDFCRILAVMPLPKGRRMAIQTHSGGPGAAAADACSRQGLDLPPVSAGNQVGAGRICTPYASINNPVDMTYFKNRTDFFISIPEILLKSEVVDMLMVYYLVPDELLKSQWEISAPQNRMRGMKMPG